MKDNWLSKRQPVAKSAGDRLDTMEQVMNLLTEQLELRSKIVRAYTAKAEGTITASDTPAPPTRRRGDGEVLIDGRRYPSRSKKKRVTLL